MPDVASPGGAESAAKCSNAADPLHPLIVDWPATHKVALDGASQRGVVMVTLAGCSLRVVNGCRADGRYQLEEEEPNPQHVEMKDEHDLLSFLPISAPQLSGTFRSGKSLVLDYTIVAERTFEGGKVVPSGDCGEATHFVKRIELGAYVLSQKASAEAGAHADIGPLDAGGTHQESDERRKASGDPDKCKSEPKDASCRAPVRLELVPLR